jgi:hypothetical protein
VRRICDDGFKILQRTFALGSKYISRQPLKGFRPSFCSLKLRQSGRYPGPPSLLYRYPSLFSPFPLSFFPQNQKRERERERERRGGEREEEKKIRRRERERGEKGERVEREERGERGERGDRGEREEGEKEGRRGKLKGGERDRV